MPPKRQKKLKAIKVLCLLQGVDLINDSILENNDAGIRTQTGTKLKNDKTGEIIYEPPQDHQEIVKLLTNLETHINEKNDLDGLINMAIIHYQFEAIHPFYNGNGRTRQDNQYSVFNVKRFTRFTSVIFKWLHNQQQGKILSTVARSVDTKGNWKAWVLYMLEAIEQTAMETTHLINNIVVLMKETQNIIKNKLPKIYSKDLIETLFNHTPTPKKTTALNPKTTAHAYEFEIRDSTLF